ncbi:YciI family protein [Dactylosporangium salmoneum]|uniref:YciI family protein n=1 Tax=Dactylosporangium salmoneum TaxID=53361 RepID=A0ABP5V8W5_9ACTN
MFVITLRYLAPMEQIDAVLREHQDWVDAQYDEGVFVASGPLVPRTGGVILAAGLPREQLEARLETDPFRRQELAQYTVMEFAPRRVAAGLERLQG